jgi:putative ABC transport system permease protein
VKKVSNGKTICRISFARIKKSGLRSVFILCAIIFTTVLVTGVIGIGSQMQAASKQMNLQVAGLVSQVYVKTLTPENAAKFLAHEDVQNAGTSLIVATSNDGIWTEYPLEIRVDDEKFAENSFIVPMIGQLPQEENEIAVKAWMLDMANLPHELGTTFPLSFEIAGKHYDLNLTVCGIWEDDKNLHPFSTALISQKLADKLLANINPEDSLKMQTFNGVIDIAADVSENDFSIQKDLERILYETDLLSPDIHANINPAYENAADTSVIFGIAMILIIVLAAGFLLIYNIFYISILTDIRHYGLLILIPRQNI